MGACMLNHVAVLALPYNDVLNLGLNLAGCRLNPTLPSFKPAIINCRTESSSEAEESGDESGEEGVGAVVKVPLALRSRLPCPFPCPLLAVALLTRCQSKLAGGINPPFSVHHSLYSAPPLELIQLPCPSLHITFITMYYSHRCRYILNHHEQETEAAAVEKSSGKKRKAEATAPARVTDDTGKKAKKEAEAVAAAKQAAIVAAARAEATAAKEKQRKQAAVELAAAKKEARLCTATNAFGRFYILLRWRITALTALLLRRAANSVIVYPTLGGCN